MIKRIAIVILLLTCIFPPSLKAQASNNLFDAYGNFYSGNYTDAIIAFDKLIKENSSVRPVDFLYRGICEYKTGRYQQALSDFRIAADKNIPEACLWIARTHVVLDNFNEAITFLGKYLQQSPEIETGEIKKDPEFKKLHTLEGWYELWQNDRNSNIQEIIDEAEYLAGKQKFGEAHLLIEGNPEQQNIRLLLCNSKIYTSEGNVELAINELTSGLAGSPDNLLLLKQKAAYLAMLKDYSEAYTILTKVLITVPEDFTVRYSHAEVAYYSGNLADAKNDIDLYLKYFNNEEAVFLAGKIEYASGRYLNALRYFNSLLEKNTSSAEYFKARGLTYYYTNTLQQAAYDLSMSLDLVPDDAEANYFLGLTHDSLGNKKMACYYMNRARKYGEPEAIEFLQINCQE